ncbi:MAG: nucleotidyltransferase domain-containing protein [Clostridiales bacterium]|nr:nucleotidyltransferase domain-containing protein [Clostridiales bacterium]
MYGLLNRDLDYIICAIKKYPEIDETIIFGSRAIGNYKKGSDVDIVVKGVRIDDKTIARLSDDLNERYPLPYFFDIVNYNDISNDELKKHIDTVGKVIIKKK